MIRTRTILSLTAFFVLASFPAVAQEYPRAEVFGGYSYLRANDPGINLNGWNASITGNLNSWFGVEADFSGHYASPFNRPFGLPFPIPGVDLSVNNHSFLFGPKVSFRESDTFTPFAHALFGVSRAKLDAFGVSFSDTALTAVAGGGVDVKLTDLLAIRAIQADYLVTRFGDEAQHNLRLSFGLVFRF